MTEPFPKLPQIYTPYYAVRDDSIKAADPQFFIVTDTPSTVEDLENAIWQNIGGHEIISLVRRDLVDGINLDYSLINNLQDLFREYNPKTIFSVEDISEKYFNKFGLKFEKFLPTKEELNEIQEGLDSPVTLDENDNVIIYIKNIKDNQEVEVQVISSEQLLRDTIYKEQL